MMGCVRIFSYFCITSFYPVNKFAMFGLVFRLTTFELAPRCNRVFVQLRSSTSPLPSFFVCVTDFPHLLVFLSNNPYLNLSSRPNTF